MAKAKAAPKKKKAAPKKKVVERVPPVFNLNEPSMVVIDNDIRRLRQGDAYFTFAEFHQVPKQTPAPLPEFVEWVE